MFKKLICLLLPFAFVTAGFADEVTPSNDVPVADNFYDPDKNFDGPVPHPTDLAD